MWSHGDGRRVSELPIRPALSSPSPALPLRGDIKEAAPGWRHFASVWMVSGGGMNASGWRDVVCPHLGGGASALVVEANNPDWALYGLQAEDRTKWLALMPS